MSQRPIHPVEPKLSALAFLARWTVQADTDRVWVSGRTVEIASWAGASRKESWEVAIAAAELASNAVRYGGGGTVELWLADDPVLALTLVVTDQGTGFGLAEPSAASGPNGPTFALSYRSQRHGLGIGLDTVRRMMSEVHIASSSAGTIVRAVKVLLP